MARIKITVTLDVDLAAMGAEYGDTFTAKQAREHIASDIRSGLDACPYSDALRDVSVKASHTIGQ